LTGVELQNDGLKNYSASSLEDKLLIKMGNNSIVPVAQAQQRTQKFSIYCFNSINDIKFALEDLDTIFKDEILYKYKGKYYLIIFYSKNNIGKKKIETNFGEYAVLINHNGFELILQEYGECLIKNGARNIINLYF